MEVFQHPYFEKKLKRVSPRIRQALADRLELFRINPYHPLLNNHSLQGDRKNYRSVNVTGDWRLVYEPISSNLARLMDIDTHHNLYGS